MSIIPTNDDVKVKMTHMHFPTKYIIRTLLDKVVPISPKNQPNTCPPSHILAFWIFHRVSAINYDHRQHLILNENTGKPRHIFQRAPSLKIHGGRAKGEQLEFAEGVSSLKRRSQTTSLKYGRIILPTTATYL